MWRHWVFLTAAVMIATASRAAERRVPDRTQVVREAVRGGRATRVIMFLGDGMGDSEITSARNYHVGAAGRLQLDRLPLTGEYTTYSVQERDPTRPDYVTDSAASATGWATGHKTSNGRLATTAGTDQPLTTILELAQRHGMHVGDVSTAELTDATPAALASHVNHRSCEGPADMALCPQYRTAAGGLGSIAEQEVAHHIDVLLGGGRDRFDQSLDAGPHAGLTVTQSAIAQGYTIVEDAAELQAVSSFRPVLGLFAAKNMSLEWRGEQAKPYPGSGPQRCIEHQRPESEPSLAAMTRKAIELLDARAADGQGFFLQVEGAAIDKRDHVADPCGQIGETIAFGAAVGVALDYARQQPDTLIVVTADHGHTSQIVPPPTATDHSPGLFSTLITADGAPMTISYATNVPGRYQEHTGTEVRIAAQGPQAANVLGITDQTELFFTMARALGLIEAPAPRGFFHRLLDVFGSSG